MPLIQNPKSAQENDRLFQNLCRKIIFEIQLAEKKSQLRIAPALDDLASSTGMSVMFADRNFGTLRCVLQNQIQIELK